MTNTNSHVRSPILSDETRRALLRAYSDGGAVAALKAAGIVAEAVPFPLAQTWAEVLSSRDATRVGAMYPEDGVIEDVPVATTLEGRSQIVAFMGELFAAIPDYTVELKRSFRAGAVAAAEWTQAGTMVGSLAGLPATGRRFMLPGATVWELRGDSILRQADYWDIALFMDQLGVTPPKP